jgi:hypothetical protein
VVVFLVAVGTSTADFTVGAGRFFASKSNESSMRMDSLSTIDVVSVREEENEPPQVVVVVLARYKVTGRLVPTTPVSSLENRRPSRNEPTSSPTLTPTGRPIDGLDGRFGSNSNVARTRQGAQSDDDGPRSVEAQSQENGTVLDEGWSNGA